MSTFGYYESRSAQLLSENKELRKELSASQCAARGVLDERDKLQAKCEELRTKLENECKARDQAINASEVLRAELCCSTTSYDQATGGNVRVMDMSKLKEIEHLLGKFNGRQETLAALHRNTNQLQNQINDLKDGVAVNERNIRNAEVYMDDTKRLIMSKVAELIVEVG